ncbi:MAG: polyamine ABC transporter ATP-binding protein [Ruminobacter sp.]|uniref:polyamine ABC transporter ATP-binding protein n=1 Tax=Ruminobacter sp. TaxID=2774296 RepID=UPI001B192455|nr:polyamine ABC transporter ATP-binding protein [Ruminobacter sp.]MBO6009901.1 polyamine ABC transporter ATP-binding protein [Ruminobacter sp.]MBP3749599.1 polyamine ABC transporter ATP-binding protein [Ruminobacter sp.]
MLKDNEKVTGSEKTAVNKNREPVKKVRRPLLEIKNITKKYGENVAVDNVDLTIYEGEIFALLGSSGCGKSTLLRMIAGFENPTSGSIILDGEDIIGVPPYKRHLNMMFQSYALFPHMTVAQNIAFGLKQEKLPKKVIEERVNQMLKLVHMEEYVDRKPHQLSGGQRQRVALARSLAKQPKLLLLDEPMGALDKKLREQMRLELVNIIESVGVTCVMVTHDQEEAMTMAERIAIMNRGEFIQVGSPRQIYENPNCCFAAEFIGSVNMFESTLITSGPDVGSVIRCKDLEHDIHLDIDVDLDDGMEVTVAIRPEKIYLEKTMPVDENGQPLKDNYTTGVVTEIAYMGDISIYHVKLNSGKVVISTLPNVDRFNKGLPTWDDKVFLSWDPESCVTLTF